MLCNIDHVAIENVKAALDQAVEAGATPIQDVREEPWGQPTSYVSDPNRQITALSKAFVVLRPIGHPMFLLWDLVTMISVELMRHLQHPE